MKKCFLGFVQFRNWEAFILLFISLFFFSCAIQAQKAEDEELQILIFTRTTDYYHTATPTAVRAMYELAKEYDWTITSTNDPGQINEKNLEHINVVVFLMTNGEVLNEEQRAAFQNFIRAGGGFVGMHSSAATETEWEWFGELVGAVFTSHPAVQEARLIIENSDHPATAHFREDTLLWKDEWYSFDRNPRGNVTVLISLDENSGPETGNPWARSSEFHMGDHPLVWCRQFDGGRSFHTALGHVPEFYESELFRSHIAGAIQWAAGTSKE